MYMLNAYSNVVNNPTLKHLIYTDIKQQGKKMQEILSFEMLGSVYIWHFNLDKWNTLFYFHHQDIERISSCAAKYCSKIVVETRQCLIYLYLIEMV